jgi:hypothetical protein
MWLGLAALAVAFVLGLFAVPALLARQSLKGLISVLGVALLVSLALVLVLRLHWFITSRMRQTSRH